MMERLAAFFRRGLQELLIGVRRGPFESITGLLLAIGFSVALVVDSNQGWENWGRFATGAGLALPGWLALTISRAMGRIRTSQQMGLGLLLLVLSQAWSWFSFDSSDSVWGWRLGFLLTSAWLALPLLPYVLVGRAVHDRPAAWSLNTRLLARAGWSLLLSLLLYIGLSLFLLGVQALFAFGWGFEPWMHLMGGIFFSLTPALFLGGIDEIVTGTRDGEIQTLPLGARRILQAVLFPLSLLWLLLLYVNTFQRLAGAPATSSGLIGWVLIAGTLGMIGSALARPLSFEGSGRQSFWAWMGVLLLPLTLGALPTLAQDLVDSGWTEERIASAASLLVLLVFGVSELTQRIRKQSSPGWIMPLTIAAISLSLALPGVGASAIALRNQTHRLLAAAQALDLPGRGFEPGTRYTCTSIDPERREASTDCSNLLDAANYIAAREGWATVWELLGGPASDEPVQALFGQLGIFPHSTETLLGEDLQLWLTVPEDAAIPNLPAGTWRRFRLYARNNSAESTAGSWTWRLGDNVLKVQEAGASGTCTFELETLLAGAVDRALEQRDLEMRIQPAEALLPGQPADCGVVFFESLALRHSRWDGTQVVTVEGFWIRRE